MQKKGSIRLVYAITLVLSACSLLYELLIAHTLSMLAANTVTWYSLTIGIYLGAMGFGAFVFGAMYRRGRAWVNLFQVEILLSIVGGLAVVVVHLGHVLHSYFDVHGYRIGSIIAFFGPAFVMILMVGFLTGVELPLLIELGNEISSDKRVTNRVLGTDYLGALVGGFLFPLLLVPFLDLFTVGFVTAMVNLLIAMFVLFRFLDEKGPVLLKSALCGALVVVLAFALIRLDSIQQYFLKKYYYYIEVSGTLAGTFGSMAAYPRVQRTSSPYQKIDVIHDEVGFPLSDKLIDAYSTKFLLEPDHPRDRVLYLNGDRQVLTNYEELYHEPFAHVPIILNGAVPEEVLVMGAGDGILIDELRKYDEIRRIVHVDLDPKMVEIARTDPVFTGMNGFALDDPRVEIVIGDAFQYARTSRESFDAIFLDFPVPMDYNLSKLYSREFYHFVRQRLTEGGFAVLDSPAIAMFTIPDEDGNQEYEPWNEWEDYYHTIRMAGFETIFPFVSTQEVRNPRAIEILEALPFELGFKRLMGVTDKDITKDDLIMDFLRDNVTSVQSGFIAMWVEERKLNREFRDLGVPLHFLNEERFLLTITRPFPYPERLDPSKVNSIMRPTFPSIPVWHTRTAW